MPPKKKLINSNLHLIILSAVLVLAAFLRYRGLSWGIPTENLRHIPFHPDEVWGMQVLSQINLSIFDFNPEMAHREGTLAYYIWTLGAFILNVLGFISKMPNEMNIADDNYNSFLFFGRAIVATLDLISVYLIYRIGFILFKNRNYAYLGALVFAISPFEIIYAHYLRTHIVANFFSILAIYYTAKLIDTNNYKLGPIVGLICGFAAAAKYPSGIIIAIPIMFLFYDKYIEKSKQTIRPVVLKIILFAILGFILVDPYIIFDFASAKAHLGQQGQYIAKEEFEFLALFDLSRVWTYIEYLIPYGSLPALWVVYYGSILYLLFKKQFYKYTLPMMLFIFMVLYPMAKGYYFAPTFIRASLMLFPFFAILSGLALGHLIEQYRSNVFKLSALIFILSLIFSSTLLYDLGYVEAMANHNDARYQLNKYISETDARNELTIAYLKRGQGAGELYFIKPSFDSLINKRITYIDNNNLLQNGDGYKLADYLVLSDIEDGDESYVKNEVARFERLNKFSLVRIFSNPIEFGPIAFNFKSRPHDLQYPFVKLYLMRSTFVKN